MEPRQIGWSQESNLLWQISKTLEFIQGNVGGLQGTITLTTNGDSGPATLVNNVLNIPEYTIEGLGGVPNTRTITINGDTQSLATDVNFTVLGQNVIVVPNYSAMPDPTTVAGAFYWAEASQGTYWLPGSLGGTFYNAGLYYSNGAVWQFMETPYQATQPEVDAGVNFTKFVTPLTFEAAFKWSTRTEWKGAWTQQQYTINQQVLDEGYLAIANTTTEERPSPQRVGEPFNIYQGTISSTTATAKQVIFGNQYSFTENVFFEGWRINVVAGNRYTVYLVRDPAGDNVISQIIQFVAQSSGWVNLSAQSLLIYAGNTYAVVAAVTEPEVTPVTFNGNWNVSQPQNPTVPIAGQITQPRSDPGLLYINNIDDAAVNRSAELGSLDIGDIIKTGTNTWAIQSVTPQVGYFIFEVSPALLNVNIGVQNFIFEETSAATLTYPLDPDPIYWLNNPSPIAVVKGLLGIDIPYQAIVPDDSAYGIGVLLQTLVISNDWDIQAFSGASSGIGGGGGGGSATTLDELTDVEIVAPLDTDVLTYESATSLWKNKPPTGGGGTSGVQSIVPGTNISVNSLDPQNPIVSAIPSTSAGVFDRVYFTGQVASVATPIGPNYDSIRNGKGSVASVALVVGGLNASTKLYIPNDIIGPAQIVAGTLPIGNYTSFLSVEASAAISLKRFTIEVFLCDNAGVIIPSSGPVSGSTDPFYAGKNTVVILDSGDLNLGNGIVTQVGLTGYLASPLPAAVGQRFRYHISVSRGVGGAGAQTMTVYIGNTANSYVEAPVPLTTSTVINLSTVPGATATDALNSLNASSITASSTNTLTNKAITKRVVNFAALTGSITPDIDTTDILRTQSTYLSGPVDFQIPTGTKTTGQMFLIVMRDNGVAPRVLTWVNTAGGYASTIESSLPVTTILGKWMRVLLQYNVDLDRWECVSVVNSI